MLSLRVLSKEIRNILVIENLETYWTLNRFLRENETYIDMVVFGGGYSIVKNFAGIIQYGVTIKDNILYYGDIDLEGICIYSLLKNKFDTFTIKPNANLYRILLKSGKNRGIKESISPNQTFPAEEDIIGFLSYFEEEDKLELEYILKNRLYIPQESLNYKRLRGLRLNNNYLKTLNNTLTECPDRVESLRKYYPFFIYSIIDIPR
ncbi:Wadjet anti-phage system protein JetD domain-containing protein [Clostridium septicum]|uniref:Wadjet anti-phage system protein JetD domain-containing protein n=1 Tax=Clostridium septicum TaxID=1504 RepID=UPI000FF8F04C|nr:Wadjet anti-phage system protein JetD domain-containing protein [Clostridium septicum]QAS60531.1 hypothetical protein EI377_07145 [Clostridium septicum]